MVHFFLYFFLFASTGLAQFTERFHWKEVKYDFQGSGQPTVNESVYKPWYNLVQGIEFWRDKLFLSLLHAQTNNFKLNDTLYSLTYIPSNTAEKSPAVLPYPKTDLKTIRSATFMSVDQCDRLWLTDFVQKHIIVIDLVQNKIIRRVNVNLSNTTSNFDTISVDVSKSNCEDAYAYIPVFNNFTLLVYRFADSKYWFTQKPVFTSSISSIQDQIDSFSIEIQIAGIYSSALSDQVKDGYRTLYIQANAVEYLLGISTKTLRGSEVVGEAGLEYSILGFKAKKRGRSYLLHYDRKNSILFYDLYQTGGIGCWNPVRSGDELSEQTTYAIKPKNVSLTHIQGINTDGHNNLWVTSRKSKFVDIEDRNEYFLYTANIEDLVKGTVCELTKN